MRKFKMKVRKGFALIFVIIIALAMIIPALILASSAIPRRTAVTGEQVSDRVLAVADSTVDNILTQINTLPFTFQMPTIIVDGTLDEATKKAQAYLISYYLSMFNGGNPDIGDPETSFLNISKGVSTYLYNLETQEYYVVWDKPNDKVLSIENTGPTGDISKAGCYIKNLTTNDVLGPLTNGFSNVDPKYTTNNIWVEIDTNTKYWPGEPDKWVIKTTSYLLSKPEIKRTVEAIASRGKVSSEADEYADGSWCTHYTGSSTVPGHNFADYSGLYATKVYFGQFETTTGMIRSNSDLYMGGWAKDAVYASGIVYDQAVDDGYKHDGKFGPDKNNLAWAKANDYAKDGYPPAIFPNGDIALKGNDQGLLPKPGDIGLQDQAFNGYYVSGNAEIIFSVENGVGKVTINGTKYDMPPNGAIYVTADVTAVSGTVKGRCTVGAGNNIYIGGNIVYDTPPRLDRNAPYNPNPDLLGLIAHKDILIPVGTFNANNHLEIDAAMLAVTGNFGIGTGYTYHPIDGTGKYEAYWNGCQATFLTNNAPAIVSGNTVAGYDIQHTNYDWNLRDYGPPPFYPPTGTTPEHTDPIDEYPAVKDEGILKFLHGLKKSELTPLPESDPAYRFGYRYKYDYLGETYYYGDTFNWYAKASMQKTALYRITWKEQIAEPVKP